MNDHGQTVKTSARDIRHLAKALYQDESRVAYRLLQTYRPYLCPFQQILDQIPSEKPRVLDVGCGAGLFLLLLGSLDLIHSGTGFDISGDAVRVAEDAAARAGLNQIVQFEVRTAESGLPAGDFDMITTIDVLHHVPVEEQESFLLMLCRRLPAGGVLIIKDMVSRPKWRSLANKTHDLIMARQLVHHRSPAAVVDWAKSEQMTAIHCSGVNTLWYGHWLCVLKKGL